PPPGSRAQAPDAAPARTIIVTVTNAKGNFIKGLRKENFVVLDGKRPLEPVSLSEDGPATVGILMDASGSVHGPWRAGGGKAGGGVMREALSVFLAGSHPENEYFVIAFNDRPQLLVEGTSDPRDVLAAVERLRAAGAKGQTALYDALYLALDRSARGRHRKRVVVMLTDGQDNMSRYSFPEVRRAVAEGDALVYALGLTDDREGEINFVGRASLEELTAQTGGGVSFPSTGRELVAAAAYIAAELRNQYTLSFAAAPAEKGDGWHELKVKLNELRDEKGKKVRFVVRTRRGFYDAARR
nr:VWA domain-containing protein [Acidobacteriota bacterium]